MGCLQSSVVHKYEDDLPARSTEPQTVTFPTLEELQQEGLCDSNSKVKTYIVPTFLNSRRSQSDSTFLSIAPELRENIYLVLLLSPQESSSVPFTKDYSKRRKHKFDRPISPDHYHFREVCNYYPLNRPSAFTIPATLLLLTCQQTNSEVLGVIAYLLKNNTLRYELDVETKDEQAIYPTWTHIPAYLTHIPCVDVTVYMTGASIRHESGWRWGNGGPGRMISGLFAMLMRFLKQGPHFLGPKLQNENTPKKKITIGTLRVKFIMPISPAGIRLLAPGSYGDEDEEDVAGCIHPETVIKDIAYRVDRMVAATKGYEFEYRIIVAEGVGRIILCYDGEDRHVWDLGNIESG